jgi:hypothetical protein
MWGPIPAAATDILIISKLLQDTDDHTINIDQETTYWRTDLVIFYGILDRDDVFSTDLAQTGIQKVSFNTVF